MLFCIWYIFYSIIPINNSIKYSSNTDSNNNEKSNNGSSNNGSNNNEKSNNGSNNNYESSNGNNEDHRLQCLLNCANKIYENPISQREQIRKENNGKIGVYAWINNINGKFYIGSGNPLYLRISDYYQNWYLNSRSNLFIVRALSKYGMANFTLVILEYTNEENVISCEQEYINRFKPEYNLNPTAGNSSGYRHTPESVIKIREAALGRKHSEEVKKLMSLSRNGENNPFYGKNHTLDTLKLLKIAAQSRTNPPVALWSPLLAELIYGLYYYHYVIIIII